MNQSTLVTLRRACLALALLISIKAATAAQDVNSLRPPGLDAYEAVDVFVSSSGSQLNGIGVVIAASKELVYVQVSGPVDLERLRAIEGRFRVPRLELYTEEKE